MNHKAFIFILAISIAGLSIGYQFQHQPVHYPVKLPLVAPRTIAIQIPNAEDVPATYDASNLMDSSILSKAADPKLSNNQKFEILWSAYQRNKSSDIVASYYLDSLVSVTPLPNAATLISELNNAMTSPELQRHLMRLLETAFRDRENNELHGINRTEILNAIKIQMTSNDSSVANEAVTIYARQAPSDLAIDALSNAHERKIIGDGEFIHEIIFKIPNVDDSKKQNLLITQMISLARNSKSPDAGNVLVDTVGFLFKYANQVKLESQTGSELKNMLIQNEPQFNVGEGVG